jgi:opacity protein-like surface antigen
MNIDLKRLYLLISTLIVIWLRPDICLGQTPSATPQVPKGSEKNDTTDSPRIPSATALGDIFFKSRNSVIFSVGAQGSATDNLYFSPAGAAIGPLTGAAKGYIPFTTLTGRLAYQRQLQTTDFGLDYGVSGMLFREHDSGDFVSQDGGIHVSHRITPRASFSIGDRLSVSPGPGRFYRRDLVLPPVDQQILPNNTLFIGLNRTITNAAYANVSYEMSRRSELTLEANGTISRFQQPGYSQMNQLGGSLDYSYRVAERTSINLGYRFLYYDFGGAPGTSTSPAYDGIARSHSAYLGITHQLTSSVSAYIQAGPHYIVGNTQAFSGGAGQRPGVRASINGGLTLSESISLDPRTFFSISAGQLITDGYGLGGITQTQSAGVSLGRRLTKALTGSVQSNYSRNRFLLSLDANGRPTTTNGITAGANLRLNATERFNLFADYIYFRQLSNGFSTLIPGRASGNTFTVGLNYSFPVFY